MSDYPQNPLPTIFAEPVAQPQQSGRSDGDIRISRATIATISTILIAILAAVSFTLWTQLKEVKGDVKKSADALTLAVKERDAAVTDKKQLQTQLSSYGTIEELSAAAEKKAEKIEELLAAKPAFKPRKPLTLDVPAWRADVEKKLSEHIKYLDKTYTDIANTTRVVVEDRTPPPGAIR